MTADKKSIRARVRQDRRLLQPTDLIATAIRDRLAGLPELRRANRIAVFAALPDEVSLAPLAENWLAAGKQLVYPRFDAAGGVYKMVLVKDLNSDFIPGPYGVDEPKQELPALPTTALRDLVWLVPGLAFDPQGRRLGRGKGYYDRLLQNSENDKIGVARDWQILPELPAAEHDVTMDLLVTDIRVIRCRENE